MDIVVPIIIVIIICVQFFFFFKNKNRMTQFKKIFSNPSSWGIHKDLETGMVDGVFGQGNDIFNSIIFSINKYLGNNSGSVIEFGLLKDAVDRHCDSVEEDISTQTPIPLYWGLAGTMAGVIIGLWDLLGSNAIMTLMGSSEGTIDAASANAAGGVNALLSGVAWAMVASICGILLTTINSLLFKSCKLQEETGKNAFLAWMQSELLPELPSDTSQALNNLVINLNTFNKTFSENTDSLRSALGEVNQSYAIQGEIIKAVHDMDVMKMAKANVRVLEELQKSTDRLEEFNHYLIEIRGYTDEIHRFETLFDQQAERLHILEEIRDFFRRHKGEIARSTADADLTLQQSLSQIKESTQTNVEELHKYFLTQSQQFKEILQSEKETFEEISSEMRAKFSEQMASAPRIQKQLEEISSIPARLDKLIEKIEKSNSKLSSDIAAAMRNSRVPAYLAGDGGNSGGYGGDGGSNGGSSMPGWMRFTGWIAVVIIAVACVVNMFVNIYSPRLADTVVPVDVDSLSVVEESILDLQDSVKQEAAPNEMKEVKDTLPAEGGQNKPHGGR